MPTKVLWLKPSDVQIPNPSVRCRRRLQPKASLLRSAAASKDSDAPFKSDMLQKPDDLPMTDASTDGGKKMAVSQEVHQACATMLSATMLSPEFDTALHEIEKTNAKARNSQAVHVGFGGSLVGATTAACVGVMDGGSRRVT